MNHAKILVVDDNAIIHDSLSKIFARKKDDESLNKLHGKIFGEEIHIDELIPDTEIIIDSAYQGEEGLAKVIDSVAKDDLYSLAFVDILMPPGWDGLETVTKMWQVDPDLQVIICTAHSDYSYEEILSSLKKINNFLILKKPFEIIEVRQMVYSIINRSRTNSR